MPSRCVLALGAIGSGIAVGILEDDEAKEEVAAAAEPAAQTKTEPNHETVPAAGETTPPAAPSSRSRPTPPVS